MKELEEIYFKTRIEFRKWISKNHDKSDGIWMIYYKKHTKIECIEYNEALEEALCFGWIDSLLKRKDDEKYVRKFSPRRNNKGWSDTNKKLAFDLILKGMMTKIGLSKIDQTIISEIDNMGKVFDKKETNEFEIPDFIITEFAKNEPALSNFNNLALTYKKHYILWITNAKKEETIKKRIDESIELLKENKKLGLK